MYKKLMFCIDIASLVASCISERKTATNWRKKCSAELIRTIDNHSENEKIAVLVQVNQTDGIQAKLEAEGLEVTIASGNIYSGSIISKKLPALANLSFVTRIETGSKPKLLK